MTAGIPRPVRLRELDPSMHTRVVDLNATAPSERWRQVLDRDQAALGSVCDFMSREARKFPRGLIVPILARLAYRKYQKHGYYIEESDLFADQAGLPRPIMAFLQRQYTWGHALCTTASAWDPLAGEMVMLRSLDWAGALVLASATRLHSFDRGETAFVSVGLTGMVGVLTAVKGGAFAIAINYAQVSHSARAAGDPTFLIRQLLENADIDSFRKAELAIGAWRPGAPCFISLTGIARGQGRVFEFGRGGPPVVRQMPLLDYLVQTNHFDDGRQEQQAIHILNRGTLAGDRTLPPVPERLFGHDLIATSRVRQRMAEDGLADLPAAVARSSFDDAALQIWNRTPILNHETVHFAILRPKYGSVKALTTGAA